MANQAETKTMLEIMAAKAAARIRAKKDYLKVERTLEIPSLDDGDGSPKTITIRSLSDAEVTEVMNYADKNKDDDDSADKYAVYIGVTNPDMTELAKIMKNNGDIDYSMQVIDMFTRYEQTEIAKQIMQLSGVLPGEKKVRVVKHLKN